MKIKIIIPYFGKLHPLFDIYRLGITHNKCFDFMIITDQNLDDLKIKNLKVINQNFFELKEKIKKRLGVYPKDPYKLCDFKPLYGSIFKKYLIGYDYWGYSDIDMILGDLEPIRNIISKNKYDKILDLGHLSFYRNKKSVNNFYKKTNKIYRQYKYLLSSKRIWVTDESYSNIIYGVNRVLNSFGNGVYSKRNDFFDTNPCYEEFLNTNDIKCKFGFFEYNGKELFFVYQHENKLIKKSFSYAHFLKKKIKIIKINSRFYFIPDHWSDTFKIEDLKLKIKNVHELRINNTYKNYLFRRKIKNFVIILKDCLFSFEAFKILLRILKFKN